jgi:hypothetical protein
MVIKTSKKLNSRQKGANAEREVAKLLKAWWMQLEPECNFVKTPLSGGFSTPAVRGDFKLNGDLMTTAKLFPWSVEIKRREDWSEETFRAGKPSPVWSWWNQTCRAAKETQQRPMLWFRKSHKPWVVMVSGLTVGRWIADRKVTIIEASAILESTPTYASTTW